MWSYWTRVRVDIPDARKPGAIENDQICSDEEGVLITVSIKGHGGI